jgi:4-hydroxy-3-methylbut-2-enyl diphosphate reductase
MKLIKARVLGFCMGVRRAVELAVEEARLVANGEPVYTLGPLIHNPGVLKELKALGIQIIKESALAADYSLLTSGCSVIIRAHGISPIVEKNLRGRGLSIIDATCPKVKASQLKVQELSRTGYCLFLAGEKQHAEIAGLQGYALCKNEKSLQSSCFVVSNADEARKTATDLYKTNKNLQTALLGQTTISEEEFLNIGKEITNYFPNLKIVNTLCAATRERQQALREILDQTPAVDAVIVVGGKESANTRRLFAIAKESGKPCVLVESAESIPADFFAFKTLGLCAGASTPDSVIYEIEKRFLR